VEEVQETSPRELTLAPVSTQWCSNSPSTPTTDDAASAALVVHTLGAPLPAARRPRSGPPQPPSRSTTLGLVLERYQPDRCYYTPFD
jgi:hypothetical protein